MLFERRATGAIFLCFVTSCGPLAEEEAVPTSEDEAYLIAGSATGSMDLARRSHSATLLADGTVLVAGGSYGAGTSQSPMVLAGGHARFHSTLRTRPAARG